MRVSVVIPTRGDVDMAPVLDSLRMFDEVLVWDNSKREDLSVYGRYAMIAEARNDLILTQDDDVVVNNPEAIAKEWVLQSTKLPHIGQYQGVVCNMPPEFRHDGYTDSALVGFGAAFHRDAPARAFRRYEEAMLGQDYDEGWFHRTCDVVFTTLTPRVLVDVTKVDREFASDDTRMWRQADHYGERVRMLELARKARDQ